MAPAIHDGTRHAGRLVNGKVAREGNRFPMEWGGPSPFSSVVPRHLSQARVCRSSPEGGEHPCGSPPCREFPRAIRRPPRSRARRIPEGLGQGKLPPKTILKATCTARTGALTSRLEFPLRPPTLSGIPSRRSPQESSLREGRHPGPDPIPPDPSAAGPREGTRTSRHKPSTLRISHTGDQSDSGRGSVLGSGFP